MPPRDHQRIRTYTDLRASVSHVEFAFAGGAPGRRSARRGNHVAFAISEEAPRGHGARWIFAVGVAAALIAWTFVAAEPARLAAFAATTLSPDAASKAIVIDNVQARRTEVDGQTILYIDGMLVNKGKRTQKSPGVVITIVGDDGRPLYTWTSKVAKPRLEAARETPFQARLLSPPEKFKSISVALANEG